MFKWWKKEKDDTIIIDKKLPMEIENKLKEAVRNVHSKIQLDLACISQRKRNQIEKQTLLEMIDMVIDRYKREIPRQTSKEIRKEIIRKVDDYWKELEPDRKVSLL